MPKISLLVLFYLIFLLIVVICFSLWILFVRLLKEHENRKWEKRRERFQLAIEDHLKASTSYIPRMKGILQGDFKEWALLYLSYIRKNHLQRDDQFLKNVRLGIFKGCSFTIMQQKYSKEI